LILISTTHPQASMSFREESVCVRGIKCAERREHTLGREPRQPDEAIPNPIAEVRDRLYGERVKDDDMTKVSGDQVLSLSGEQTPRMIRSLDALLTGNPPKNIWLLTRPHGPGARASDHPPKRRRNDG